MESVIRAGKVPPSISSFQNQLASDLKYTKTQDLNLLRTPTMTAMEQAELETEPSTSNCLAGIADVHHGAEPVHVGSTKTAVSNTRSPTITSSSNSEDRAHSSKSSQTSADFDRDLRRVNVGHYPPYMPNIDLLQIGAQFAEYFADGNGNMGSAVVGGGGDHSKYLEELVVEAS